MVPAPKTDTGDDLRRETSGISPNSTPKYSVERIVKRRSQRRLRHVAIRPAVEVFLRLNPITNPLIKARAKRSVYSKLVDGKTQNPPFWDYTPLPSSLKTSPLIGSLEIVDISAF